MGEGPGHSDAGEVARKGIAAAIGSAVGLGVGGPAGAVVGAVAGPALEPLVGKVWEELRGDARTRAEQVFLAASDAAGVPPEEMAEHATATAPARLLTGLAMDAASRSAYPPKAQALGQALAAGLFADDVARVDEQQLVIVALAELEAPHVAILDLIVRNEPKFAGLVNQRRTWQAHPYEPVRFINGNPWPAQTGWTQEQLASAQQRLAPVLNALLGTMQRHGLVAPVERLAEALAAYTKQMNDDRRRGSSFAPTASRMNRVAPPPTWESTGLGHVVLNYLLEAGAQAADSHCPD